MADKFDERFPHGLSDGWMWSQGVGDGEERKEDADADDFERLEHHVLPPKARKPFVPDGSQELLHVGVSHKLEQQEHNAL